MQKNTTEHTKTDYLRRAIEQWYAEADSLEDFATAVKTINEVIKE
jgi:predicted DNA-binding protein